MIVKTTKERFFAKVEPHLYGCWLWTGAKNRKGYGMFWPGVTQCGTAHRASYRIFNGHIPPGQMILHSCNTPSCVNPNHLRLGSHRDNMDDMVKAGRGKGKPGPRGTKQGRSKLTETQVLAIRADTRPQRSIAREYGISQTNVCHIQAKKVWAWL